jgi:hypothetical protein
MAMHARTAALHLVLVVALASTCRRSSGAALGPEQQGTFNKIWCVQACMQDVHDSALALALMQGP